MTSFEVTQRSPPLRRDLMQYYNPNEAVVLAKDFAMNISVKAALKSGGAEAERAQAQTEFAHHRVTVAAAGGAEDRRVRVLDRFGEHSPPRHLPVFALELVLVVDPAADRGLDRFPPHLPGLIRVDTETLEFDAGGRATGAVVDPAV